MDKSREDQWFRWTGWVLFGVTLMALAFGIWEMGYAWDEAVSHFRGCELLLDWLSQVYAKILAGNGVHYGSLTSIENIGR